MKISAIIPAGGAGKRLGAEIAKQYLLLHSRPVLAHTLLVFQKTEAISEIVLVLPPSDAESVRRQIIEPYGLTKITAIVSGGLERQDSVRNGLRAIENGCDIVIVHDGVRPLLTKEMLLEVAAAAALEGAASIGVPVKDTIKETDDNHCVKTTLPRQRLWHTQTPQAFQYALLCRAHKMAESDHFQGTDDSSLVERMGIKTRMITGSYKNIKITTPEDLQIAECLMEKNTRRQIAHRSGLGYDSHRFALRRKLILGGVEIPFEYGLQGHSDADALIHAVCDALLGMAGAGDIGRHFPDSDPAYQDISSLILLERVKNIIEALGMSVNNIDVTIMTEKPKIAPHAPSMVANISKILNIPKTAINIKAKTNESMGFIGRREGVAVLAIAHGEERILHGCQSQS